jgi:hypothetical protein
MNDWSDQRRAGDVSGALREGEQTKSTAPRQAWSGDTVGPVVRAGDAAKRRMIGVVAVIGGGVMMAVGAAMVAASVF